MKSFNVQVDTQEAASKIGCTFKPSSLLRTLDQLSPLKVVQEELRAITLARWWVWYG